jgi:hypothetical protein
MMAYSLVKAGQDDSLSEAKILAALFNKDRALAMKRILAEQFRDMEGSISAIEGPQGSVLIADRNAAAMKVLKRQIDAGKKKIAIFYGGGHMPDFQKRLKRELDLVPKSTRWVVAWNLKGAKTKTAGTTSDPGKVSPGKAVVP